MKKQIAFWVWGIHLFILLALSIHHIATRASKPSRPIAIRTFIPQRPAPQQIAQAAPKKTAAPSPIPVAKPAPAPKKQTPAKKSAPAVQESTVQHDMAAALEALKAWKAPRSRSPIEVPSLIHIQQSGQEISHPSYGEFLIGYLEQNLDLPEYGEVKIKLTIDREGRVKESAVLSSENPKNSEFLKNRLPQLSFPCFNDFSMNEKYLTFTISFRNAENRR